MISAIRWNCAPTRRSACRASSAWCAPAEWCSPMVSAAEYSSRRRGWGSCRRPPSGCWARNCGCRRLRPGGAASAGARLRAGEHRTLGGQADVSQSEIRARCSAAISSRKARADLARAWGHRPHAYVAQERLAFSQAPVWRNGAAARTDSPRARSAFASTPLRRPRAIE